MTATNTPRPRRLAGHRPSTLSTSGRPRKVADSRRAAVRAGGDAAPQSPSAASGRPVAPDGPGEGGTTAAAARSRAGRLSVVLLAVAVVLAVAVGLLAWDLERTDSRADARKAAQVVAADSMETILSYRYSSYDKGVAEAKSLMTPGFARTYARTVDDVRSTVMQTRSVVKADVVASSVISAEPDRVKALLFVNQTTTGRQVQQPRVDLNRVVVTLVHQDGTWLVSDLDAL